MFLLNCIKTSVTFVLRKLKLVKINKRLIVLGVDNAGKTSLLLRVQSEDSTRRRSRVANYRLQVWFQLDDVRMQLVELDYRDIVRQSLRYAGTTDAIVYVIDASNPETFEESNQQLQAILNIKELKSKPILILGNKIDKLTAVSESYLRQNLGLFEKGSVDWNKKTNIRPVQLFMCTIVKKMGFGEGFRWLNKVTK